MKRFIRKSSIIKKAEESELRKKINKFLFKNNLPESIYTRGGLIRNLQNYIEDAYSDDEKQQRIKDAENVKKDNNKYYVIEEDGNFTGYMTLDDAIKQVIEDYKHLYEDEPEMIKQFEENINKIK